MKAIILGLVALTSASSFAATTERCGSAIEVFTDSSRDLTFVQLKMRDGNSISAPVSKKVEDKVLNFATASINNPKLTLCLQHEIEFKETVLDASLRNFH